VVKIHQVCCSVSGSKRLESGGIIPSMHLEQRIEEIEYEISQDDEAIIEVSVSQSIQADMV
jgi:hypothetical protein